MGFAQCCHYCCAIAECSAQVYLSSTGVSIIQIKLKNSNIGTVDISYNDLLYTWMYTTHMTHSLDCIGKTSLGMSLIRVAIHWDNYLYVKSNVNAFIHAPAYRSFPDLVCHDQPRGHWLAWGMQPGATKLESKRRQRGLRLLSSLVDRGCMPQTKQWSRTLGIFVGGKEQGESDTTGGWGTSLNVTILEGGKCI